MASSVDQIFTTTVQRNDFQPPVNSSYIYGSTGAEDRSIIGETWIDQQIDRGISVIPLVAETRETASFQSSTTELTFDVSLYNQPYIQEFLKTLPQPVHIDITAIAFGTWAAFVRGAMVANIDLKVLYVEPKDYLKSSSPIGNLKYNLSDRTEGIAPLPGFARLTKKADDSNVVFVPLLGFEGDRLARVLEEVQAPSGRTYPVIGLPGFKPEYPFHSLEANIRYLDEKRSTSNIQYARANCPFSLYNLLVRTAEYFPESLIQVAALGTKPHALGAAIFAIKHPNHASLLYDHPIRSNRRTSGSGKLCIYDISRFLTSLENLNDMR